MGVSKMPGAMVTTRISERASSRAIGSVMACDRPLGGGVGRLADLAVERGDRSGVDDDAALRAAEFGHGGIRGRHGGRGQADDVEGAHEVDLDDAVEALQRQHAVAAQDLAWRRDPGAVDHDPQRAEGCGGVDGGLHLASFVTSAGTKTALLAASVRFPAPGPPRSPGLRPVSVRRRRRPRRSPAGPRGPPRRRRRTGAWPCGSQAGGPARDQRDCTLDVHASSLMWNRTRREPLRGVTKRRNISP